MNANELKKQFPIFQNNPDLVYLDNAATSQKPKSVINAISDFYSTYNSNVHRGLYPIAEKATAEYEKAREKIAKFIGAEKEEIIFVLNATDGINLIANSLERSGFLEEEPMIVISDQEHHSNLLPWQGISNAKLQYLEVFPEDSKDANKVNTQNIYSKADVIALSHMSNVTGSVIDVEEIVEKYPHPYSVLDASQSVAHTEINVKDLGVDFLVFSGHKVFGPTGIGVMYIKKEILNELEPAKKGGGMIDKVERERSSWISGPERFEAGTPNIAGAIGLSSAIEFVEQIGFENIIQHEDDLRKYTLSKLKEFEDIKIFHSSSDENDLITSGPVISFTHEKIHPHDIAAFLGQKEICVRAGHHCAQILHRDVWNVPATVRISLSIYNSKEDINKFVEELRNAIKTFI